MPASFQQLIAEHDAIDAQAAAIMKMCGDRIEARGVARALDHLACDIDDHLANEDGLIYPVVSAMRDAGQEEAVARMIEQLAALRADWCAYLARWTVDRIKADPARFTTETTTIMGRLQERVQAETEYLYPIALGKGLIRLREAAV